MDVTQNNLINIPPRPHFSSSHTPTKIARKEERNQSKKKEIKASDNPTIHLKMVKTNTNKRLPSSSMASADIDQSANAPNPTPSRKKQYKGVRMRSWGSWVSEIRAPNQKTRIWLGSYSTPEAAARAYDAALLCLKGSSANLNFPCSSTTYLPNTLLSPKSIQRVAAAAAANVTPITAPFSPPPPPPPPPPSSSSPSLSSSSSWDTHDEIATPCSSEYAAPCLLDPWIDFDEFLLLPKYEDDMINAWSFLGSSAMEDCDEEGDIPLWSFC